MKWNEHYRLQGKHAFLGASKWQWINYDDDKLLTTYQNFQAIERGTRLHGIAAELISEHIKLPRTKQTLNMYVNDAIGYGMSPEVVLFYSDNCFGTTDAILFNEKEKLLRIHDLKTGVTPAHIEQLMIYAALFCLEYHIDIHKINVELRIYQNNEIIGKSSLESSQFYDPELRQDIKDISVRLIDSDQILEKYKNGLYGEL